jgi:hypothetical protein
LPELVFKGLLGLSDCIRIRRGPKQSAAQEGEGKKLKTHILSPEDGGPYCQGPWNLKITAEKTLHLWEIRNARPGLLLMREPGGSGKDKAGARRRRLKGASAGRSGRDDTSLSG